MNFKGIKNIEDLIKKAGHLPNDLSKDKNEEVEESSLEEKIGEMNSMGIELANYLEKNPNAILDKEDMDIVYGVADGLIEANIMKHLNGETSLQRMMDVSIEDLEKKVDKYIIMLTQIKNNVRNNH